MRAGDLSGLIVFAKQTTSKMIQASRNYYLPFRSGTLRVTMCYTGIAFSGGSEVKASACNAGDLGSIPGLGRSPGEGNGNPLQYPCLENPMDGGAWWAIVHGVATSQTRLSEFTFTFILPLEKTEGTKYSKPSQCYMKF